MKKYFIIEGTIETNENYDLDSVTDVILISLEHENATFIGNFKEVDLDGNILNQKP